MSDFLNSLGVAQLNPHMVKLPFVQSFIEGGPYIPHPSEPPLFSRKPGCFNKIWCDWFAFVLMNDPDNGDNFNHLVHEADVVAFEKIRVIAQRLGEAILADVDKLVPPFKEEPPSLFTANGRYISHAWVLDTAKRDNMPIYEAVALGCSLKPT